VFTKVNGPLRCCLATWHSVTFKLWHPLPEWNVELIHLTRKATVLLLLRSFIVVKTWLRNKFLRIMAEEEDDSLFTVGIHGLPIVGNERASFARYPMLSLKSVHFVQRCIVAVCRYQVLTEKLG
jgi:hypothetical protein